jgi:hypothetical protein
VRLLDGTNSRRRRGRGADDWLRDLRRTLRKLASRTSALGGIVGVERGNQSWPLVVSTADFACSLLAVAATPILYFGFARCVRMSPTLARCFIAPPSARLLHARPSAPAKRHASCQLVLARCWVRPA